MPKNEFLDKYITTMHEFHVVRYLSRELTNNQGNDEVSIITGVGLNINYSK